MNSVLLYLPPVWYAAKLFKAGHTQFSDGPYIKQSLMNRCYILGANGVIRLSVPVRAHRPGTLLSEIEIDNTSGWQRNHWRSICSAYGKSLFFEYYQSDFEEVYASDYDKLYAFNLVLHNVVRKSLSNQVKLDEFKMGTQQYDWGQDEIVLFDYHKSGKSEVGQEGGIQVPYPQVFGKGFVPHLSVIDLLFNKGPDAFNILSV